MTPAVHQFVSSFVPRDAVSTHALLLRGLLRDSGVASEIFVKEARGEMLAESRSYRDYSGQAGAVLLYHAATGSVMADYLLARPEPLIVNYHNITPPEFFAPWEPHTAVELAVGRRQVADLATTTAFAIADSPFNADELMALGYDRVTVAPLVVDPAFIARRADEELVVRLRRQKAQGGAHLLFVGRLAPNKAQHDAIKALDAFRRLYDPAARLTLIGSASSPRYGRALRGFVGALGLEAAVDIRGETSDAELAAYYEAADAFLCLSEHEGFCVPIIEAMHHGLPVVAFGGGGAVPDTVGSGGVLLPTKDAATIAAALRRVTIDAALRAALVSRGRERAKEFSFEAARSRWSEVLGEVVSAVAA